MYVGDSNAVTIVYAVSGLNFGLIKELYIVYTCAIECIAENLQRSSSNFIRLS